jgi:hypothetical protein
VSEWKELRSEVSEWDDHEEEIHGFDGFTRFWCKHAVFDVYWVAEGRMPGKMTAYLTSDVMLTGFREPLPFECDNDLLVTLAQHVGWARAAQNALQQMLD